MYESINRYDCTWSTYNSIQDKLHILETEISNKKCFLGFDGYIDFLYSLVESRESPNKWERMKSMDSFGQKIIKVSGSAASIERVLKRKIAGGFAPNTSRAMTALGANITLVAALGYPNVLDVFSPLIQNKYIHALSISNPGETIGLEFDDGKIMISDFGDIHSINWNLLKKIIGIEQLSEHLEKSQILGFGHWSLTQGLSDIWKGLMEEIFVNISIKDKLFFTDLSDIKKRSRGDVIEMTTILEKIEDLVPVLLSLNDQEVVDLSKALNIEIEEINTPKGIGYYDASKRLYDKLNLSYIVVHSPYFATITSKNYGHFWVTEGFTSKPRFTTGAGDHFHSGTVLALKCGLTPAEAILFGNALTAVFVRTGKSPNFQEVVRFISNYMEYIEKDNPNF